MENLHLKSGQSEWPDNEKYTRINIAEPSSFTGCATIKTPADLLQHTVRPGFVPALLPFGKPVLIVAETPGGRDLSSLEWCISHWKFDYWYKRDQNGKYQYDPDFPLDIPRIRLPCGLTSPCQGYLLVFEGRSSNRIVKMLYAASLNDAVQEMLYHALNGYSTSVCAMTNRPLSTGLLSGPKKSDIVSSTAFNPKNSSWEFVC